LQLGCREGLPEQVSEEMLQDDSFLRAFHHALLEVCTRSNGSREWSYRTIADVPHVLPAPQVTLEEGALVCPDTGRKFPVAKGIPNLLLNEDEC
jgi:multifunctional methyltransferase subunit TRM112